LSSEEAETPTEVISVNDTHHDSTENDQVDSSPEQKENPDDGQTFDPYSSSLA